MKIVNSNNTNLNSFKHSEERVKAALAAETYIFSYRSVNTHKGISYIYKPQNE